MSYDNIIYLAVEDKIKLITIAKHNWHENIASDNIYSIPSVSKNRNCRQEAHLCQEMCSRQKQVDLMTKQRLRNKGETATQTAGY